MMIQLNGRPCEAPREATLLALLVAKDLARGRVAVEVNGRLVRRADYSSVALQESDRVEVVQFVGGG